jgi:hypothetical protein
MRTVLAVVLICVAGCAREPKPTALESASEALGNLRTAVMREVKDPQRAQQGIALVDEVERLLTEAHADLKAHNARIRVLNADYDATQDAFRAAFQDFNAKQRAHQRRVVEINQRAKLLLTGDEWETLGKVRQEALERTIQTGREG